MPVLKLNELALPKWSELDYIELLEINPGRSRSISRISKNETIYICEGKCTIKNFNTTRQFAEGEIYEVDFISDRYTISSVSVPTICIRVCGWWTEEKGNSGIFSMKNSVTPNNKGDKSDYDHLRKTDFDNHFHDFDEYWIIYEGSAKVVTEGNLYEIKKGDCVATKAGDHHDMLEVYDELKGVYFETSLKGAKRMGHLWNHTHAKYQEVV